MDSHYGAYISSQISSTCSDRQVFLRIEAIGIYHEVAIILVDGGRLASVTVIEELGKSFLFDVGYLMHVEPGAVTRQDYRLLPL